MKINNIGYRDRYIQLLAGRGMKIGDLVVCDYRMPTPHQWWTHPLWIGEIQDVSEDPASWNGHNSEAYFCAALKYVSVQYLPGSYIPGHHQYDSLANLRQVHQFGNEEPITESPSFMSPQDRDECDGLRRLADFAARFGWRKPYLDEYQAIMARRKAVA